MLEEHEPSVCVFHWFRLRDLRLMFQHSYGGFQD
jgi:hypothetical protein